MVTNTNTASPKSATFPTAAPEAIREMVEKSSTQAKDTYEKVSVAAAEAGNLMKSSYSTAVTSAQDFNNKAFEFAQHNTKASFDFAQKLSRVKSPVEFMEISTEHSRQQFATLTEQAMQLATLAHKVTLATTEPLKTGVTKAFGQVA